MAFGQQSGPPASAKQVRDLLALLKEAGHADFRDARGPMGFTQRQAGGKFARDEAAAFISRLEDAEPDENAGASVPAAVPAWRRSTPQRHSAPQQLMSRIPSDQLADELRRRGWTATEPTEPNT
jgi:hypothetical protein